MNIISLAKKLQVLDTSQKEKYKMTSKYFKLVRIINNKKNINSMHNYVPNKCINVTELKHYSEVGQPRSQTSLLETQNHTNALGNCLCSLTAT